MPNETPIQPADESASQPANEASEGPDYILAFLDPDGDLVLGITPEHELEFADSVTPEAAANAVAIATTELFDDYMGALARMADALLEATEEDRLLTPKAVSGLRIVALVARGRTEQAEKEAEEYQQALQTGLFDEVDPEEAN